MVTKLIFCAKLILGDLLLNGVTMASNVNRVFAFYDLIRYPVVLKPKEL